MELKFNKHLSKGGQLLKTIAARNKMKMINVKTLFKLKDKKDITNKLITIFFLIIVLIIMNESKVKATNYSFNFTGPSQANLGDIVTLTITADGLTGNVKFVASNATISDNQKWVEKNSISITAKITGFPATITATPVELSDNDYNIVSISSKTITIKEIPKQESITTPNTQTTNLPATSSPPTSQATSSSTSKTTTSTSTITGKQSADQAIKPSPTTQNSIATSSNNYLKSLGINIGTLSPTFARETFEYKVDNIIENEIKISAEVEDGKSTVSGIGSIALKPGENIISITVTAENGAVRIYKIIVNKKENIIKSNLKLSKLKIEKINEEGKFEEIDFGFLPENYEYKIDLEDNITDLNVQPTIEKEGIIVEITGANNLKEGVNIITITLTNQANSNEKSVYTVRAVKAAKPIVETGTKPVKNNWIIIIIVIIVIIILSTIGIIIYKKKRKSKKR